MGPTSLLVTKLDAFVVSTPGIHTSADGERVCATSRDLRYMTMDLVSPCNTSYGLHGGKPVGTTHAPHPGSARITSFFETPRVLSRERASLATSQPTREICERRGDFCVGDRRSDYFRSSGIHISATLRDISRNALPPSFRSL